MRPHAPTLLLYMCPPTRQGLRHSAPHPATYASSCSYFTIILYMCPHTGVCVILRRILLCVRPHAPTTTMLLYARSHTSCILNVCSHTSRMLVVH
jgi:hypothetical protein